MKNKIVSVDVPLPASGHILITRKNRIGAYYGLQIRVRRDKKTA